MRLAFALLCAVLAVSADEWVREDHLFHRYATRTAPNGEVEVEIENYPQPMINWEYLDSVPKPVTALPVSYWDFIPAQIPHVAILANGPPVTWEGTCYKEITATLEANTTSGTLTVKTSGRKNPVCSEFYDFGDRENLYLLYLTITNTHRVHIKEFKPYEYQDLVQNGMKAFLFPGNPPEMLESLRKTLSLFKGKNMVQNNVDFISQKMQWQMQKRSSGRVDISKDDVKSGDYLAILRLDGLDPLIMWGTGGHTGHTAIALWFGDELYICESTDSDNGNGTDSYWPPPYGIIRTPFDQWMDQAEKANYMVALLRLSEDYQSQFNEDQAVAWFKTVEGMPYGWHNFIYTFIDTMFDNLPRPTSPDLIEQLFGLYEPMAPLDSKSSLNSMVIMGLNHRLGSSCDTMQCIYDIIDPQNIPLFQVAIMPEQDQWMYPGNGCPYAECYSMVCDVFVTEMYQNAGLNLPTFQATEQSPKDTYEMALFESNWHRPKVCDEADPDLPYCQLLGDYTLTLNNYNSRVPYQNMNNECPAYAPVYMRTPSDC
jgi:hypothetical protein